MVELKYQDIVRPVESTGENSVDKEELIRISQAWKDVVPAQNFGILEAITAANDFTTSFKNQLELSYTDPNNASVDAWLAEQPQVPYTITAAPDQLDPKSQEVRTLHQEDQLKAVEAKLRAFTELLNGANLPAVVRKAYDERVAS